MKKYIVICLLFLFVPWVFASDIEDNSILDEVEKTEFEESNLDITMKSFESCDAFEDVMEKYIKEYWKNSYQERHFDIMPMMMRGEIMESVSEDSSSSQLQAKTWSWTDHSETNTQVQGVDEPEIVKTDGRYLYYFNDQKNAVYIIDSGINDGLKIIKKINIPKSFYGVELFLSENRLVILASGYLERDYSEQGYYINRNTKSYTIVYDTQNITSPKLIKLFSADGDYAQSRLIGDTLYLISRNYISFPYWNYSNIEDIEIEVEKMLPKKLDISLTQDSSKQNLTIKGKTLPYSLDAGNIVNCSDIAYTLPDTETLKEVGFNPGYNLISAIDIRDTEKAVKTQVVAGSNTEIYMSQDNLYMTEGIWQPGNFSCPVGLICARPFFWGGSQNTLVHKLSIDQQDIEYKNSALIPGSPLTQYSMDEHDGNFRIITSQWSPERSTDLYILDEDLTSVSSLTNLAPGESFQSSRFMGDKLYLVTFEQVDPLFAIDLSDITKPEVLGELKIPGFSTYLHPYDETHIIGLGYDTELNEWWGVQTAWVKVDLYKINFDKKCGDADLTTVQKEKCESWDYKGIIVEQLHTKTFGGKGSYSEALNNPRMFVWHASRQRLLLPVSLYEKDASWRTKDYFQGMLNIGINPVKGISLHNKITHIDTQKAEEKRVKDCEKYILPQKPVCRELLNGEEYCEDVEEQLSKSYIPNYCYKDSSVLEYLGDRSWEFKDMNIQRALYIGENVYTFSPGKVFKNTWEGWEKGVLNF